MCPCQVLKDLQSAVQAGDVEGQWRCIALASRLGLVDVKAQEKLIKGLAAVIGAERCVLAGCDSPVVQDLFFAKAMGRWLVGLFSRQ